MKRIKNIRSDITKINNMDTLYPNQANVLNILFMVDKIFTGEIKSLETNNEGLLEVFKEKSDREKQGSDEQLDTADIPELESEESTKQNKEQRGVGPKILTPDQILSRLPITLAQLKSGNNSQKLINEIRQLLYYSLGNNLYEHQKWQI